MRHMVSNLFTITLDPLLDTPLDNKGDNNEFKENRFKIIYSDS